MIGRWGLCFRCVIEVGFCFSVLGFFLTCLGVEWIRELISSLLLSFVLKKLNFGTRGHVSQ